MDLNDLTIGQARELAALFGTKTEVKPHPFVGKYVIARCRDAGVHAGVLVSAQGREAVLKDSRRLWQWRVPMGSPSFLSGVAVDGIDQPRSKVGSPVEIALSEVCELIVCSESAETSIRECGECPRTN